MDAAATTDNNKTATVQHVTKRSSDELLRKFAELGDDEEQGKKEIIRLPKRRKRSKTRRYQLAAAAEYSLYDQTLSHYTNSLVERRSLLPQVTRKSLLLRRLGIGRSQLRARDLNNKSKSILVAIQKTWRKTLEGASKVHLEKRHINRHKRLISDVV